MTNRSTPLAWVMQHMPVEAAAALDRFTTLNPSWRGANWDDCLDALMDADANLETTEPIIERLEHLDAMLVCAVTLTILYSDRGFAMEYDDAMRATAVAATIGNNHD
jgi:hypothetical protein